MTDLNPKVLAQRGNEAMAAMAAVTAGIDIRDGNFTDAIIASVWEHDAILKLKASDPEFKEVVGVGYVWYSPDEAAWHEQRQATLVHLNQNSVADICKELDSQGALFDIGRPDYATTSRTQAVGAVADRLRERGATKIIMFLQSAPSVTVSHLNEVMIAQPHLGAVHEIIFCKNDTQGHFTLRPKNNQAKGFAYRPLTAEEAENFAGEVLNFGDKHWELLNAPQETWLLAWDLLFLFLKSENALPEEMPGKVRLKRAIRGTGYFLYAPLSFARGIPSATSFLSDYFNYGVTEASVNEQPNN